MLKIRKCFIKVRLRSMYSFLLFILVVFVFKELLRKSNLKFNGKYPYVIWWTPGITGNMEKISRCSHGYNCIFTYNRRFVNDKNLKGFLFYGTEFSIYDLPLPRRSKEIIWGIFHEESPRNTPILSHNAALALFNYSATFSRYSNTPLTLQYLDSLDDIYDTKYYIDVHYKNLLLSELAPILYIQSDCDTSSYREDYVKELMKYIPVDSYGRCLNNKKLPEKFKFDYLNNLNSDEFLKFVNKYKFTISIENGICDDYITEKLWRPLKVGSIPIYMGSPTVKDWLPNENSAIIALDFKSPKHLANYLHYLNKHDNEYDKYLEHKRIKKVTNLRLKENIIQKNYNDYNFLDPFECFICKKIYQQQNIITHSIVNISHYNCQSPEPPWSGITPSWWMDVWHSTKLEAQLLKKIVLDENSDNFTEHEFKKRMQSLI